MSGSTRQLAAPLFALGLGGCGYRRGALDPASTQAHAISVLWWVFFWTSVAVFSAVFVALVVALVRGHSRAQREGPRVETEPEPGLERRSARAVTAATALSVVILVGLLVASVARGRELFQGSEPAIAVKVIAHQWWWEVQYPGPRDSDLVITANELHLPAGRTAELELRSVDVIHSLWIPNLQGKRDLIPGHTTRLVIVPERVGRYDGHCAEFCGAQHARMDLPVSVDPPARFAAWLAAQRRPAPVPSTPAASRGAELFMRGPCAMCHAVTGTDASASAGPNLTHVASRPWLAAGALVNSPRNMREWLRDPQSKKPGSQMPATGLTDRELDDLLVYLETLQ
jgi:cytochrome c oxidase subunit 2